MADSNTNLPQLAEGQPLNRRTVNALVDALSPGSYWGRNKDTCGGLTWGYLGGVIAGERYPNGTLPLDASSTCYIEHDESGTVSFNTSGFTDGRFHDYVVVTGSSGVSSYQDLREPNISLAMIFAAAGITLTVVDGSITFEYLGKSGNLILS